MCSGYCARRAYIDARRSEIREAREREVRVERGDTDQVRLGKLRDKQETASLSLLIATPPPPSDVAILRGGDGVAEDLAAGSATMLHIDTLAPFGQAKLSLTMVAVCIRRRVTTRALP